MYTYQQYDDVALDVVIDAGKVARFIFTAVFVAAVFVVPAVVAVRFFII
ncbi:hypothetical protein [Methylotenera mobilis]|uniref:Uncharacterized protein n=1 Tax=Methylotenera mobilis (strain JLW8 / ATCC BAA-1282 / DSM 17540) TaxID=583345 RepID=C6WTX1_METML|nr:hypothetical protein [Methylotenera mobilis]ACT47370.1 hypothetical protein Mmol_0460 [Methylotenera mobilis JLW8]